MKPRHGSAYRFDAGITGGTSGSTTIEAATLRLRALAGWLAGYQMKATRTGSLARSKEGSGR
jgi:hypothetical protein